MRNNNNNNNNNNYKMGSTKSLFSISMVLTWIKSHTYKTLEYIFCRLWFFFAHARTHTELSVQTRVLAIQRRFAQRDRLPEQSLCPWCWKQKPSDRKRGGWKKKKKEEEEEKIICNPKKRRDVKMRQGGKKERSLSTISSLWKSLFSLPSPYIQSSRI